MKYCIAGLTSRSLSAYGGRLSASGNSSIDHRGEDGCNAGSLRTAVWQGPAVHFNKKDFL